MYINKLINLQKYKWCVGYEAIEVVWYSVIGFFLPFMLAHPQWLVGTIVNALLINAAITIRGYKLLPVILLPSLGVLSAGLIFGNFTVFLLYMIPFIWIGNSILVLAFKLFNIQNKWRYMPTLILGAAAKTLFLFTAAFILFKLGLVPAVFLTAMGIMQLVTALSGGVLAFAVEKVKGLVA